MKKFISMIIVFATCFLVLASCGNSNIDDPVALARKFAKTGYKVDFTVDEDDIVDILNKKMSASDIECIFMIQSSENDEEGAIFIYCRDKDAAKDVKKILEDSLYEDLVEENFLNPTVERSGTCVFGGTKAIWKDIK